jgi:hypothetical protein
MADSHKRKATVDEAHHDKLLSDARETARRNARRLLAKEVAEWACKWYPKETTIDNKQLAPPMKELRQILKLKFWRTQ